MKTKRPIYAIVMLCFASLWICGTFLPLFYFVLFPSKDLQQVVHGLKGLEQPAPEALNPVQETTTAAGRLIRAIPLAYYTGVTKTVRVNRPQTVTKKQGSYVAWFQGRPKALILVITTYEDSGGRKEYEIAEGEPMPFVRAYSLPVLLFGVALLLVRKRKAASSPATAAASTST